MFRQTWDSFPAKFRLDVHAVRGISDPEVRLWKEVCAGNVFVLHALRGVQNGDLLGGILLQRQSDGLLQAESNGVRRSARWWDGVLRLRRPEASGSQRQTQK